MRPSKLLQSILLAAILALPLGSGVSEAKQQRLSTSTGKSFARRAPDAGITRFAEIRPGLSRGGALADASVKYLRDRGYKTVVSFLTEPVESAAVVNAGMKYVHIPMRSNAFSAQPPTDSQVKQFLEVTRDSTQYPMYIHCKAGKDRTGAMTAIYRMEACGWTKEEAIQEMKSFGFAGRYKRLYNYVKGYIPIPTLAKAPADSTVATTK
jgi:protein tyrosine phosphatase (PTP) superfamily phosphohydrolase (DUF442 family)